MPQGFIPYAFQLIDSSVLHSNYVYLTWCFHQPQDVYDIYCNYKVMTYKMLSAYSHYSCNIITILFIRFSLSDHSNLYLNGPVTKSACTDS